MPMFVHLVLALRQQLLVDTAPLRKAIWPRFSAYCGRRRVAAGDCSPAAPTDTGVPDLGIRLLGQWRRCATANTVNNARWGERKSHNLGIRYTQDRRTDRRFAPDWREWTRRIGVMTSQPKGILVTTRVLQAPGQRIVDVILHPRRQVAEAWRARLSTRPKPGIEDCSRRIGRTRTRPASSSHNLT